MKLKAEKRRETEVSGNRYIWKRHKARIVVTFNGDSIDLLLEDLKAAYEDIQAQLADLKLKGRA